MDKFLIRYISLLLTVITLIVNTGCDEKVQHSDQYDRDSVMIKFKQFIKKFKPLTFPYVANTDCFQPDSNLSVLLDMDNDSIFINYVGPGASIGMLPDTSQYFEILYCTAASCYIVNLAVYTKEGKLISSLPISEGCGAGEGYECEETLKMESPQNITVVRKKEQYSPDSLGNKIPGTDENTIYISKYWIDKNGIIKVKKEQKSEKK